jgi:hypothetical protein
VEQQFSSEKMVASRRYGDVAVGLLQAESGARAEEWFGWEAEVNLVEEAVDRGLVRMLEEGLKSWKGAERGHSES